MMNAIMRYSFIIVGLILIGAAVGYGVISGEADRAAMATLLLSALFVTFHVLTRRGGRTPANPEKRVRRLIGSGRPLVVYFFSDYDLLCLLARPFCAVAERRLRSRCDFVYIDVGHPEAELAATLTGGRLGQFVLYDGRGERLDRVRILRLGQMEGLLERTV